MKVTIFGAGNVGATTAHLLVQDELSELVLVDIIDGFAEGKALDLQQYAALSLYDINITGTTDGSECKNSDIVVITSGLPRKPNMTREDLLLKNAEIIKSVCVQIKEHAPNSIVIVATNPLDPMVNLASSILGFEKHKVMGMAGVLDSARMCSFLAEELDISVKDISAMVIGGHGDDMVPLKRYASIAGIPAIDLLDEKTLDDIIERTRNGGAEIVGLLKTGSAYYTPAFSLFTMIKSIFKNEKRLLPCSVWCNGDYDINNLYVGVPAIIGKHGVEQVKTLELSDEELTSLQDSAKRIENNLKVLRENRYM